MKTIRTSILSDATYFIQIKKQLPMNTDGEKTSNGGFLLGTDLKTYQWYIQNAFCLTAMNNDEVVGFGILLPDHFVRQSEVWQKRDLASWNIDISPIEQAKVCYFEQLAFLKGNRRLVLALVYQLVEIAFKANHDILLTTTVSQPISNLAAVPFIKAVKGQKIGNIDEIYPEVGQINSDIWAVWKDIYKQEVKNLSFYPWLLKWS